MQRAITVKSAYELPLTALCELINDAFTGYVGGNMNFAPQLLARIITREDVDLDLSQVIFHDDTPAAIALLARRGRTSRVAMMGVAQRFQGQGIGKQLMQMLETQSRERGDHTLTLEVIEQNPRAVRLYESCGYTVMRRLMGYTGENLSGEAAPLSQIDPAEAARSVTAWADSHLPWQCSGESLVKLGPPHIAYQWNDCFAILSDPHAPQIVIRGIAVPPAQQRKKQASRLLSALIAAHPDKHWRVVPICPEEYGPIFLNNGFQLDKMNQFQMIRSL